MWNPFDPYRPELPPVTPKPVETLDTPGERAKLTDLTIGEQGKPAAHETAAVIRMHRAGFGASQICAKLGMFPYEMRHWFKVGMDDEGKADRERKAPIHDARVPKGTK